MAQATTAFIQYMQLQNSFSAEDEALIRANIYTKNFQRGENFLEVGKLAHQIGFLASGVCRYFFYDKDGNEITSLFWKENDLVTNLSSFSEYIPSSGTIQAETDCQMVIIDRKAWELFSKEIPLWDETINSIKEKFLINKVIFQRALIQQDAKTAYLHFITHYPSIIQRASLGHIASFLGITQFSLSRIRKQIMKDDFLPNDKK